MKHEHFYLLVDEAQAQPDLDTYVAEWGTSSLFLPDPDDPAPDYNQIVADLTNIHSIAHMDIKALVQASGLTQTALARRFDIPLRTLQGWCSGSRQCPPYVKLMMADLLGLITVHRE